jgi:hypothetical protein
MKVVTVILGRLPSRIEDPIVKLWIIETSHGIGFLFFLFYCVVSFLNKYIVKQEITSKVSIFR